MDNDRHCWPLLRRTPHPPIPPPGARVPLASEVNAFMGHSNVTDVPLRRPASGTHSGRSVWPVGTTLHATISAIGGLLAEGVQRPQSNALWSSFDDAEDWWGSRERHIEGGYWLGEAFQCQTAEVFECDYLLYRCSDATGGQDLAIPRLSTEPSGEVAHRADRGVA